MCEEGSKLQTTNAKRLVRYVRKRYQIINPFYHVFSQIVAILLNNLADSQSVITRMGKIATHKPAHNFLELP